MRIWEILFTISWIVYFILLICYSLYEWQKGKAYKYFKEILGLQAYNLKANVELHPIYVRRRMIMMSRVIDWSAPWYEIDAMTRKLRRQIIHNYVWERDPYKGLPHFLRIDRNSLAGYPRGNWRAATDARRTKNFIMFRKHQAWRRLRVQAMLKRRGLPV